MTSFFSNTLSPLQWALFALIPPAILLLYFLKLKRQPLEVPSTFLWSRTIEDMHVNSIWQRLRRNLLLFLQLLLLLFAAIACLRPSFRETKLTDNRLIFMIDASASMSSTDVSPTRLEEAKKRVGDLIGQMKSGDVAMLVSFSDRANVEQAFTDDRRTLLRKLKAIIPTHRPSDLNEAIRVASGLANPGRTSNQDDAAADEDDSTKDVAVAEAKPATMYIMSDGGFRHSAKLSLGNLKPVYVKLGEETAKNYAITAFSTAQNPELPDVVQAYGSIQNFSDEDVEVETSLYLDGDLKQADSVKISAGETGGVEFELTNLRSGTLRMEIDNKDDLQLDNVAYAAVNTPQQCRILVVSSDDNQLLRFALETEQSLRIALIDRVDPSYLQTEDYKKEAQQGAYDLIIYDDCTPDEMPLCNTMFIGADHLTGRDGPEKSENESKVLPGWKSGKLSPEPIIIDTNASHPVMQYVQTADVQITEAHPLTTPRGGSTLIDSDIGPLLAIAPRVGYEDLVMGMKMVDEDENGKYYGTNWVVKYGFPVFIHNVLRYMGGVTGEQSLGSVQPGQPIKLRSTLAVDTIEVQSPANKKTKLQITGSNDFVYNGTEAIGIYNVREGKNKDVDARFAVNLFDTFESQIQPRPKINTEYEEIEAEQTWESTRREGWKYLLILALVVLLVEWYIYNRRVYL